jgi:hypothetical protein
LDFDIKNKVVFVCLFPEKQDAKDTKKKVNLSRFRQRKRLNYGYDNLDFKNYEFVKKQIKN